MSDLPFWKTKSLAEMSEGQWESLCDGCAKCCLVKLEDEDTREVVFTNLHCRLLNPATCQCSNYANRKKYVSDCIKLTPESVGRYDWLPLSCAYRLVAEGKDLPEWHYLVCGDRDEVHRRGASTQGRTVNEDDVNEDEAVDHIVDWANRPPEAYRRKARRRVR